MAYSRTDLVLVIKTRSIVSKDNGIIYEKLERPLKT